MSIIANAPQSLVGKLAEGRLTLWEALTTANHTGDSLPVGDAKVSITAHAFGTWGGAVLALEGTLDGTTWGALNDASGEPVALSANGFVSLSDLPIAVRPRLSTVGSGADIDILLLAR